MPTETMTTQLDAVLAAEVGYLVSSLKIPHTLFRMKFAGLHVVLCSNAVKLVDNQLHLPLFRHIALVDGHANLEESIISVF